MTSLAARSYTWRGGTQRDPVILRDHGRHVPAPQPDAVQVRWRRVHGTPDNARLHDQTCTCRSPVLEYVSAGGLYFVRRLTYTDPVVVEETERLPERDAAAVWTALLTGQAR